MLSTAASLLWLPQAGLVAWGIARLGAGDGAAALPAAAGFVTLAAVQAVLEHRAGGLGFAAAAETVSSLRAELAGSLGRRGPRDAAALPAGAAAALGAEKLDALLPHLARFGAARLRAAVVPIILLLATAAVNWAAALVLLVAGPLIPLFMALVGIAARAESERQMAALGTLTGLLLDRLRALADIRLLGATALVTERFAADAEALRAQTMAVLRIAFLSSAVLELFSALGVAMVAVLVGFSLLGILDVGTWGTPLTLGEGLFVLMLAPEFFRPLRDFAAAWHDRAAALAVAGEVAAALDDPAPGILGNGAAAPPLAGPADIVLHAVRLPGGPTVTASLPAGAAVAVTGPSGAGKSTLLAVMAGLARPDGGTLHVAGLPLDEATADAWRARLAWVGQRPHFVAGSLRANVALAGSARDVAGVRAALAVAAATGIVERAPRGLDLTLGESGHGVSGGEGRRLAVARAAHARRDVILADEPTADLDADTAAAVIEGLMRLAASGATLIVATHDPALIARLPGRIELGAGG
jgi:ATP-binding cassette subfamily C protein CydD